jgi:hypothetical protein
MRCSGVGRDVGVGDGAAVGVAVAVGGMGVAVVGISVGLGGTGVAVGGNGMLVGGLRVNVGVKATWVGAAVGDGPATQPPSARHADTATSRARLGRRRACLLWRAAIEAICYNSLTLCAA